MDKKKNYPVEVGIVLLYAIGGRKVRVLGTSGAIDEAKKSILDVLVQAGIEDYMVKDNEITILDGSIVFEEEETEDDAVVKAIVEPEGEEESNGTETEYGMPIVC